MIKNTPLTDEQRKLVEENHKLIYSFLGKFHLPKDEYYDLAAIALCNAARQYNPENGGAFSSYAFEAMENMVTSDTVWSHRKKRVPKELQTSYEVMLDNNSFTSRMTTGNFESEIFVKMFLEKYLEGINDRSKLILKMTVLGYPQADIMEKAQCSRANIALVKNKFRDAFRKELLLC